MAALRSALVDSGAAPAPANVRLAAVRGVLRAAWRLGLIDTDAWQRAADMGAVKGSRLPAGRALEMTVRSALFESCADRTAAGARDACLLTLLYGAGLRRAEAAAVQVADVEEEGAGGLTVRVVGKGNRERAVYADNGGGPPSGPGSTCAAGSRGRCSAGCRRRVRCRRRKA